MSERRRIDEPCVGDDHCVTCSDEAVPMRVLSARPGERIAICGRADGGELEVMLDLVGAVVPSETLLVHAGVALARIDGKESDGE